MFCGSNKRQLSSLAFADESSGNCLPIEHKQPSHIPEISRAETFQPRAVCSFRIKIPSKGTSLVAKPSFLVFKSVRSLEVFIWGCKSRAVFCQWGCRNVRH